MDIFITEGYNLQMKWHHEQEAFDRSPKHQLLGTALIAVPLVIVVFALLSSLYVIEKQSQKTQLINELVKQERAYLDITALAVENNITNMTKDLLTLKDFTAFAVANNEVDTLAQHYRSMAGNYCIYDQIRYIDEEGNEKVRVNYKDGKAEIVPPSQLQNKKDRYYFKNSHQLQPNEIYISPLDLNIENGELEFPHKPMIRLATPVWDASGMPRGIVILNYLAGNVLEIIESVYRGYEANLSLVNQEGYFLIHDEDRAKEFGFMFEDGEKYQLSSVNAEIYAKSEAALSGWYATDRGLFSFTRLYPFEHASSTCETDNDELSLITNRSWLLITHIQQATIDSQLAKRNVLSSPVIVVIVITVFILLVALSYLLYHKKDEGRYIQFLAHFDQLTGCYNRGWGLKILQNHLSKAKKKKCCVAILFIDLDKFKAVNDTYGHKTGDAVLIESVRRMKSLLRQEDSIIRLGGDEFLVVLSSLCDENVPKEIPQRLHTSLQEPFQVGNRSIQIGSSIGIAVYPKDGNRINELVSASDKAMYRAKTNKDVTFVFYTKEMA